MSIANLSLLNTRMQMCRTDDGTDPFPDPSLFLAVVLLYLHIVYEGLSFALSGKARANKSIIDVYMCKHCFG